MSFVYLYKACIESFNFVDGPQAAKKCKGSSKGRKKQLELGSEPYLSTAQALCLLIVDQEYLAT